MDQTQINEVMSHKHLGIILTNDCNWHEHIEHIKAKAWNRINVMRKLKFKLDRKSLQTMYFSFIRPVLEYADVIWNNCTQYESNELVTTVSGICNPTLNVLLYGDPSLSLEQNKYIVKAVQDFILKSKRFQ